MIVFPRDFSGLALTSHQGRFVAYASGPDDNVTARRSPGLRDDPPMASASMATVAKPPQTTATRPRRSSSRQRRTCDAKASKAAVASPQRIREDIATASTTRPMAQTASNRPRQSSLTQPPQDALANRSTAAKAASRTWPGVLGWGGDGDSGGDSSRGSVGVAMRTPLTCFRLRLTSARTVPASSLPIRNWSCAKVESANRSKGVAC